MQNQVCIQQINFTWNCTKRLSPICFWYSHCWKLSLIKMYDTLLYIKSMKLVLPSHFISWKISFSSISRKCILPNTTIFGKMHFLPISEKELFSWNKVWWKDKFSWNSWLVFLRIFNEYAKNLISFHFRLRWLWVCHCFVRK